VLPSFTLASFAIGALFGTTMAVKHFAGKAPTALLAVLH
jgi:hypothetical protein